MSITTRQLHALIDAMPPATARAARASAGLPEPTTATRKPKPVTRVGDGLMPRWHGNALYARIGVRLETLGNCNGFWRKRHRGRVAHHVAVNKVLGGSVGDMGEMLGRGRLRITLTRHGPRVLDDDNLAGCFKHVRDAIAELIGVDDADARIRWVPRQVRDGVYECGVRVEVRR